MERCRGSSTIHGQMDRTKRTEQGMTKFGPTTAHLVNEGLGSVRLGMMGQAWVATTARVLAGARPV
jgi:hypothetical protein